MPIARNRAAVGATAGPAGRSFFQTTALTYFHTTFILSTRSLFHSLYPQTGPISGPIFAMPRTSGFGRNSYNSKQKTSRSRPPPDDSEAASIPVASGRDLAAAHILQDLSSSVNLPPEDEASCLRKKVRSLQASLSRAKKELAGLKLENASLRSEVIGEAPNKKRKVCSYSAVHGSVSPQLISRCVRLYPLGRCLPGVYVAR